MRDLSRRDGLNGSLPCGSRRQRPRLLHENADRQFREKFRAQRPAKALPLLQSAAVMRKTGTSDENAAKLSPEDYCCKIIAENTADKKAGYTKLSMGSVKFNAVNVGQRVVEADQNENQAGRGSDKIFNFVDCVEGFAEPLASESDENSEKHNRNCGANAI